MANFVCYGCKTIEVVSDMTYSICHGHSPTPGSLVYYTLFKLSDFEVLQLMSVYDIRIQSPFIMTQKQAKDKLGIGYKILSVETERDLPQTDIKTIEDAVDAITRVGFRSLARAHHPDLGGDPEKMVMLNKAKNELLELLKTVRSL